jgi:hypothetical protein
MYDPSLVLTTQKGLNKFNRYYKEIKKNNIYWIICYLNPRVKTRWLVKNYPNYQEILNQVKSFLKEAYLQED